MPSFFWILLIVFVVVPAVRGMSGGPWHRGWGGRRWDLDGMDDGGGRLARREIAELKEELAERMGEIDLLTSRVAELENRLDFTERLLAQGKGVEERASTPATGR